MTAKQKAAAYVDFGYALVAIAVLLEALPFIEGWSPPQALAALPGEIVYSGYEFNVLGLVILAVAVALSFAPGEWWEQ
jgi:hypothetical protein